MSKQVVQEGEVEPAERSSNAVGLVETLLDAFVREVSPPLELLSASLDHLLQESDPLPPDSAAARGFAALAQAIEQAKLATERLAVLSRCVSTLARATPRLGEDVDLREVVTACVRIVSGSLRRRAALEFISAPVPLVRTKLPEIFRLCLSVLISAVDVAAQFGDVQQTVRISVGTEEPSTALCRIQHEVELGVECPSSFSVALRLTSVPTRPGPSAGRPLVAVVDDDTLVRKVLEVILAEDFDVASFASSRVAFASLVEGGFDVIFCDVMMPDLDGTGLYTRLCRERPELGERFVFVSGGGYTGELRAALRRIGRPVLRKPCSRYELLQAAQTVLRGAHSACDPLTPRWT